MALSPDTVADLRHRDPEELINMLQDAKQEAFEMSRRVEALQEAHNKTEARIESMREGAKRYMRETLARLESRIAELEEENRRLSNPDSKESASRAEVELLQSRATTLEKEREEACLLVEDIKRRHERDQQALLDAQACASRDSERWREAERRLDKAHEEMNDLRAEVRSTRASLEDRLSSSENRAAQLLSEKEALASELESFAALEAELEQSRSQESGMADRLVTATRSLDRLRSHARALEKERDGLRERIETAEREYARREQHIREEMNQAWQAKVDTLQRQVSAATTRAERADERASRAEASAETEQAARAECESRLARAREELAWRREDASQSARELETLRTRGESSVADAEEHRKRRLQAREEVLRLSQCLESRAETAGRLAERVGREVCHRLHAVVCGIEQALDVPQEAFRTGEPEQGEGGGSSEDGAGGGRLAGRLAELERHVDALDGLLDRAQRAIRAASSLRRRRPRHGAVQDSSDAGPAHTRSDETNSSSCGRMCMEVSDWIRRTVAPPRPYERLEQEHETAETAAAEEQTDAATP